MRIAIDGIVLRGRDAGSLRYFEQLVSGLGDFDSQNEYVVFVNRQVLDPGIIPDRENLRFKDVSLKSYVPGALRQQLYRSWDTAGVVDLLHCPAFVPPVLSKRSAVTTIFDLTFEIYPETMKWTGRFWWRLFAKRGIRKAAYIITLSESTKRDLIRYYHIDAERIRVIYPCTRDIFNPHLDGKTAVANYRLPSKYVLYVGTLERRKNIPNLIRAFARAKRTCALDHVLVLVGKRGWLYQDIFQLVAELGLREQVMFLDYVPDDDLPELYRRADLFAYLSRFEGFGLPVLEAMACGTPVLTSNVSSLPEVVGNAGVMVPPDEIEQAAEQMVRILSDPVLQNRMAEQGLERAKLFSKASFISQTIKVYEEAGKRAGI